MKEIEPILSQALQAIEAADDLAALDRIRVDYLGKKGQLTTLMKTVGALSAADRPRYGQAVNQAKTRFTEQLRARMRALEELAVNQRLLSETLDITMPGRTGHMGGLHPLSRTLERIESLFVRQGFAIHQGPEVEDDFHNFEALNIPPDHPARDMHDTFYFADGRLLRTHTSPVQIRAMERQPPPIWLIAPGRVFC